MKKIFLLPVMLLCALASISQDFSGDWHGMLRIGGAQLRLTLNLVRNDTGYTGKLISVDQGNTVLPLMWARVRENEINFKTALTSIEYEGKLDGETIQGTFKQGAQKLPLIFGRTALTRKEARRPQEPVEPLPYKTEDITFLNAADSIKLAGTLTIPSGDGQFPTVVLISGSGPQNRNEELAGHKPFLVLADHLTRNGIAVLRYDDRGVGKSQGVHNKATSVDLARDVQAALTYLKTRKEVDQKNIGLVGHSEGGMIAPMVAAENSSVSYIVLLAGTGVNGREVIKLQSKLIAEADGAPSDFVTSQVALLDQVMGLMSSGKDPSTMDKELDQFLGNAWKEFPDSIRNSMGTEAQFRAGFARLKTPWMKYFLTYEPSTSLSKLKIPVLALNGGKDLQVWPGQNLPAISKALDKAGNKKYKVKELSGLNHLFQECTTGSPSEYGEIEQTMAPVALNEISEWIRTTIRR